MDSLKSWILLLIAVCGAFRQEMLIAECLGIICDGEGVGKIKGCCIFSHWNYHFIERESKG